MQWAQACAGVGLSLMFAASSAIAGQVELSIENRIGGDSNVFRTAEPDARKRDGTWEFSPSIGAREGRGDLTYQFNYRPVYRNFFKTQGIDGVDHNAFGKLSWSPNEFERIEVGGNYYNGRLLRQDLVPVGSVTAFDVNDRTRLKQSSAYVDFDRQITPRFAMGFQGNFDDFDGATDPNSQTDSRSYTGRLTSNYALDPLTKVGLSVSAKRRENRAIDADVFFPPAIPGDPSIKSVVPRASSKSDVFDMLASISRAISPTIRFSAQIGPSLIRQQQFPGQSHRQPPGGASFDHEDDRSVNLFASASLSKEWRTSNLSISYVRSEARTASTSSGSSITDSIQLDGDYRVNDRITLRTFGYWNQLDQAISQQGGLGRFKLRIVSAIETIEVSLSRRVLLIGQYNYTWQENDNGGPGRAPRAYYHIGFVGIRYTFEPLEY